MFENAIVKLVCFLLKRNLTLENRNKLSASVLDSLGALPLHNMFEINEEGELLVGGKVVSVDKAIQLKEYANSALDNQVLNLIREQVAYEAVVHGVHKANGDIGQLFMRNALWWEQRVLDHLKSLAGRSSS